MCKACFYKEISLRKDSYDKKHRLNKLWCWLNDTHVFKDDYCDRWIDKERMKSDPKQHASSRKFLTSSLIYSRVRKIRKRTYSIVGEVDIRS